MAELRFAVFGTGFWSRFQLAGWRELDGARCVAAYNRTRAKAEQIAAEFDIPSVYDDPQKLLASERLDFVDIITAPSTHHELVLLAAKHKVPVICQKPIAETLEQAEQMVAACREANVPLLIHENWRWQHQIRKFREVLQRSDIGRVTRARLHYCSSFPVFENQPFLAELERFLLDDVGVHLFDTVRFLFGEPRSVYCRTKRVNPRIRGEDMATAIFDMGEDVMVNCEISYASITEQERFPQTYFLVEAERGSAELAQDYWIRVTTAEGTHAQRHPPPRYPWADPAYEAIHSAIVPCNADMLAHLTGERTAETTGEDNLRTFRAVQLAYESAERNAVIAL